jgi:hypothetical protein
VGELDVNDKFDACSKDFYDKLKRQRLVRGVALVGFSLTSTFNPVAGIMDSIDSSFARLNLQRWFDNLM